MDCLSNTLLRICILKHVNNIEGIGLRQCIIFMFCKCIIKYFNHLIQELHLLKCLIFNNALIIRVFEIHI